MKVTFLSLLLLSSIICSAQSFNFDTDKSLLTNLRNNAEFTLFIDALMVTGLVDDLSPANTPQMGYTVFCPTNAAFQAAGINPNSLVSNADIANLRDILLYHICYSGPYGLTLSCPSNGSLPMANGQYAIPNDYNSWTQFVSISNDCQDIKVNQAKVIYADTRVYGYVNNSTGWPVAQDNGMIQVIDGVLVPPNNPLLNTYTPILNKEKEVVRIVNLMGQKVEDGPNQLLIYMYSDGSTARKYRVE